LAFFFTIIECECCVKLKLELSEAVSELKPAKETIRILKEDLDMANSSEHNASTPSNLNKQKDQTHFQTKSSSWNKIPACHPARNRGEMVILQKAAVRTSNSFDVLSNLKDAPDYHQSKMKRKHVRGPKKLHDTGMNLNCTIPVIVNGQVSSSKSEKMSAISDKGTNNCDVESPVSWFSSKSSYVKDHKVLIIGDSHARNCAANVKSDIRGNFKVQGPVKPGSGTDILVNSANCDIMSLSKSDVLIFCRGPNDVGKNNSTTYHGLRQNQ